MFQKFEKTQERVTAFNRLSVGARVRALDGAVIQITGKNAELLKFYASGRPFGLDPLSVSEVPQQHATQ